MKCKLGDICAYRKGKVAVSKLNLSTYVSTESMRPDKGGITEASSLPASPTTQVFQRGDVLVSNIRPYFKKIWRATCSGGCSNDVLVFAPKEGTDSAFLYYVLSEDAFFSYATATSKGTKMPRGDRTAIMQYQVPFCDSVTQKRIAAILSALDDKIENNKRINRHLEQMAQALFTQRIGEVLDARDSPDCCQIGDRLRFLNGFAFKSIFFSEAGQYKVVTIKNVQDGIVDASECSCVDDCPAAMPLHCRLVMGDVLLSLTGNVGRVGVVSEEKLLLNQRVAKLSPINAVELPFWYFLFRQAKMKERLIVLSRGTAQANLSPIETMKVEICYNKRRVLDYSQVVAPMFSTIVKNLRANRCLAELRDALLPRLLSGEIKIEKQRS